MAALPRYGDKAGLHELDAKCENRNSPDSTRTVVQLSKLPLDNQTKHVLMSAFRDLPHLIRCLLEAGLSADVRCGPGNATALQVAACSGSTRALRALLAGGANHALVDEGSMTPLLDAVHCGKSACVHLLLDAGADANAKDRFGNTALMLATINKHVDCAQLLLPRSELSITNHLGRTALHVCVTTASEECFRVLLPQYADVDVRTVELQEVDEIGAPLEEAFDVTPLQLACEFGQHEMAKALLKRGASRKARDSRGCTPLHRAVSYGHLRCAIVLLGRADNVKMTAGEVNAADNEGRTPLHFAAQKGREKICGLLIEAGARLDAKTTHGYTPLMVAQHFHPANAGLHALLSGQGHAQLPGTVCDHCGKTPAQASVRYLKTCSACQSVRYCGAACSAAAWRGHKAACKARVAEVAACTSCTSH